MKRIINILLIGAALILSSCGESGKESKALDITGTWELTDIEITKAAQLGSETIEVSITFNQDKTFSLSQTLGSGRPKDFSGTWQLTGTILTGKYSNGKAWGSSYEVTVNGTEMTMTPEGGAEIYTYKKK
jgi:hypothetical protein